jgi:predicted DCC family thiol-disulfide oxidoreductase YuxK
MAYWAYSHSKQLMAMGESVPTDPLWLMRLIGTDFFLGHGTLIVAAVYLITLLTVLFPGRLILRLGVFLIILISVAYTNSFGSASHGSHFQVYVSFALLFLPSTFARPDLISRVQSMQVIAVFWFAQSILLFSYTSAGVHKILGGSLLLGDGLVRTVLNRAMQNGGSPFLLEKFLTENAAAAEAFLLGNLYIQLFSLFVLFRPNLHKPYGVMLILFHFGTFLLMHILFSVHIIIWGLFFVMSPMAPRRFSLLATLQSLPVFGLLFRLISWNLIKVKPKTAEAYLIYDGECPFCSRYSRLLNVREKVGNLTLINARDGGPLVEKIQSIPFDLNQGMVFIYGDDYYFGDDALHILGLLSSKGGIFSSLNRILFSSRTMVKISYPILRFGRNMTLKWLNIPQIEKEANSSE